jgi:hypothetical protein
MRDLWLWGITPPPAMVACKGWGERHATTAAGVRPRLVMNWDNWDARELAVL